MEEVFQIEFMSLPLEDLQDNYGKLFERYRKLRDDAEADTQRIYELKRKQEASYATETYLTQEIEQLMQTLSSFQKDAEGKTKTQTQWEELRRQHHTLTVDYTALQQEYASMAEENAALRKQVEAAKSATKSSTSVQRDSGTELSNRVTTLEEENLYLMQKLEEFQNDFMKQTMALAERESNIEILRDQVICLEENLNSKREELEEKNNLLESTQEQLVEANSRLALVESNPEGVDRKGNSLFAEVDDQRQAMKRLLAQQKKIYMEMKKDFHDSQYEIRRLKRENIGMRTELNECSTIFCAADRTYQDKRTERIRQLLCQVEGLEKQLKVTQDRLRDLASGKGVEWLDSMLDFCRQETDELKKQLHGVRIQKASLEEQLRNVKQDMIRWRFEALKSRCVLIDRENILNENALSFKPVRDMEFNINQTDQEVARPRIVSATSGMPQANIDINKESFVPDTPIPITAKPMSCNSDIPNTSPDVPSLKEELTSVTPVEIHLGGKNKTDDKTSSMVSKVKVESEENVAAPQLQHKTDISVPIDAKNLSEEERTADNITSPNKLQLTSSKSARNTSPDLNLQPGRSILSKRRDVFDDDKENCGKNVQFSAQGPTIHEISANITNDSIHTEVKHKAYIKQVRTKSNVIVRHVYLAPKREPT